MSATPIIPGFNPDPSITRVGDDYYLVTSSFEYAPAVPIYHSTDLLEWEQIGNILNREEQLAAGSSFGSSGIFAPSLRHHDGRFYMVTTNVQRFRDGHLLTWSNEASGPWSIPVYIAGAVGIDPDLSWDEDGTCYLTWSAGFGETRIVQAQLDPSTGALLTEPVTIFGGEGLAHGESPHLFHRGDWWYLLLAEGGTERGHMVTIARSLSISGPFESNPANPILSHRSTAHPVQNTGHADVVETSDGDWVIVYLGVRVAGRTPHFHVNGRETFLAGIDWVNGWPVVDENRFTIPVRDDGFEDIFTSELLHPRWISPGVHPQTLLTRVDGGVIVTAPATAPGARPLLAVRATAPLWRAEVELDGTSGRFTVRLDDDHWAAVEMTATTVDARAVVGTLNQVLASAPRPTGETITLVLQATAAPVGPMGAAAPDLLSFGFFDPTGEVHELATIDGRYFSTEVAGGFTGRVIGVEPIPPATATGTIRRFAYQPVINPH